MNFLGHKPIHINKMDNVLDLEQTKKFLSCGDQLNNAYINLMKKFNDDIINFAIQNKTEIVCAIHNTEINTNSNTFNIYYKLFKNKDEALKIKQENPDFILEVFDFTTTQNLDLYAKIKGIDLKDYIFTVKENPTKDGNYKVISKVGKCRFHTAKHSYFAKNMQDGTELETGQYGWRCEHPIKLPIDEIVLAWSPESFEPFK